MPEGGLPQNAPGYPSCHVGWRDLIDVACGRMAAVVRTDDRFVIDQVKEKLGGLRLYWSGGLDSKTAAKVEEAIDLAEARADCTCERCGAEGRLRNSNGWLATACDDHAEGSLAESDDAQLMNLQVVRAVVDGKIKIVKCRRYDRNADAFIDVDPLTVGLTD